MSFGLFRRLPSYRSARIVRAPSASIRETTRFPCSQMTRRPSRSIVSPFGVGLRPVRSPWNHGARNTLAPSASVPLIDVPIPHFGEEQARLAPHPYRSLREHEAVRELLDARIRRHQRIESGVDAEDRSRSGRYWRVRRGLVGARGSTARNLDAAKAKHGGSRNLVIDLSARRVLRYYSRGGASTACAL